MLIYMRGLRVKSVLNDCAVQSFDEINNHILRPSSVLKKRFSFGVSAPSPAHLGQCFSLWQVFSNLHHFHIELPSPPPCLPFPNPVKDQLDGHLVAPAGTPAHHVYWTLFRLFETSSVGVNTH